MKNLQNTKKGFTLVELLAVIAILAVIGAFLIPNLVGMKDKAHKSNIQTSAKAVVSTAKNYGAEIEQAPLSQKDTLFVYATDANHVEFQAMLDLDSMKPRNAEILLQTPMNRLKDLADGKFTVKTESDGTIKVTIKGSGADYEIASKSKTDDSGIDSSLKFTSSTSGGTTTP